MMIDVTKPFGIACFFWSVLLMIAVLFGKDAFVKEGKPRWKAVVMSIALFIIGVLCFMYRA